MSLISTQQSQMIPNFMIHYVGVAAHLEQEDNEAIDIVLDKVLEECVIPIKVITDTNDETLAQLIETNPHKDKIKIVAVILVIRYLKIFEA